MAGARGLRNGHGTVAAAGAKKHKPEGRLSSMSHQGIPNRPTSTPTVPQAWLVVDHFDLRLPSHQSTFDCSWIGLSHNFSDCGNNRSYMFYMPGTLEASF